jgi:hypothetical protein
MFVVTIEMRKVAFLYRLSIGGASEHDFCNQIRAQRPQHETDPVDGLQVP